MGSYLEINNRETNSKLYSRILIYAIRDIHSTIMNNKHSTEKKIKSIFFLNTTIQMIVVILSSGAVIGQSTRRGMALLTLYLKELYENDEAICKMAIEDNKYRLEKETDENKLIEIMKQCEDDMKRSVLWCYNYAVDLLADMILAGIKRVTACWV